MNAAVASSGWYDEPMRWMQINLVEDDPGKINIREWVDYWRHSKVDAVTISAAGAVAYYPTELPLHRRSAYLGSRDIFGEFCLAAKQENIRILARFEANFLPSEVFDAHPGWFRTGQHGEPQTMQDVLAAQTQVTRPGSGTAYPADIRSYDLGGKYYMPCWHGPYYRAFIPSVMAELARKYPIDGFFANGWPQPIACHWPPVVGIRCYCTSCLDQWSTWSDGAEYPAFDGPDDPIWTSFVQFVQQGTEETHRLLQDHARSLRSGLSFVACTSGSISTGVRWSRFGPVDIFVNECQGRGLAGPKGQGTASAGVWIAGRSTKIMRSVTVGGPLTHIVGAWQCGGPSRPPLRRLSMSQGEIVTMMAQAVAKGARPWILAGGGTVYDRRWMKPVADYFNWHASVERYLRDRRSMARVALVWSPTSCWPVSMEGRPSTLEAINGWYLAMLRARVPFEILCADAPGIENALDFAVVIIPSGTALIGEASDTMDLVIDSGKAVMGCGVTLTGGRGAGPGKNHGSLTGPHRPSYLRIDDPEHPLVTGIEGSRYIPSGPWILEGGLPPGRGVGNPMPPLPFLAEKAYYQEEPMTDPLLVLDEGNVYLGTDLDAAFGVTQLLDLGTVLANAVRYTARNKPAVVTVEGPGLVDVEAWEQADAMTIHLVNLTSPDLYGAPLSELPLIGPFRVRVAIPEGRSVTRVLLLRQMAEASWQMSPDSTAIEVAVEHLAAYEVVAVHTSP